MLSRIPGTVWDLLYPSLLFCSSVFYALCIVCLYSQCYHAYPVLARLLCPGLMCFSAVFMRCAWHVFPVSHSTFKWLFNRPCCTCACVHAHLCFMRCCLYMHFNYYQRWNYVSARQASLDTWLLTKCINEYTCARCTTRDV